MNSGAVPAFFTVIDCAALVVPVSCGPKVSDDGVSETAGAEEGCGDGDGAGAEGVHPASRAEAEVAPSLTVTWHVDELYGEACTLNAPFPSLVPRTAPGVIVIARFGTAPLPSTRSWPPFSSDRVTVIAAAALPSPTPNVAATHTTTPRTRPRRLDTWRHPSLNGNSPVRPWRRVKLWFPGGRGRNGTLVVGPPIRAQENEPLLPAAPGLRVGG